MNLLCNSNVCKLLLLLRILAFFKADPPSAFTVCWFNMKELIRARDVYLAFQQKMTLLHKKEL